ATQAIVFDASRSSADTASSRCSFRVSSSFVCERPRRLWTNIITVGMRDLAHRLLAEPEQRLVEEDGLDRPDLLPLHLDRLLRREALARLLRLREERSELRSVEMALVEELLG